MKLEHLALLVGGLYVLGRTASATSPQTGGTTPYMEEMPVSTQGPLAEVINNLVAPKDLSVPATTATGQFTGNAKGAYDIITAAGTLHVLPYDPRQTIYDANALEQALRLGAKTPDDIYATQYRELRTFTRAWQQTYSLALAGFK